MEKLGINLDRLLILEVLLLAACVVLIFIWFDWKLFVVLFIWQFYNNVSKVTAEKNREIRRQKKF